MRLPGPSMPSQRQSQTAAGIALVILALFTAFAVTQAVRPSQEESTLSQRDNIVQARQFLPWIFGGGQTTTIANPAQPAITTPLPAAAPPTPNNQQQQGPLGGVIPQVGHIIPSLLASLTSALAAVVTPVPSILNPGNVVSVVTNVAPAPVVSILQPGGGPVIPTAIPNVEGSNGGLLPPIQSAVNSIVGVGGSALPLPAGSGLPVPLPTQVVGGIPVSEVTAAIGNGASIITNIPEVLVSVVSSIVGHIPSAVNNLPSLIPVSDIVGATAVVPGLSSLVASVLQSASVIMPLPTTAPQLPEDLPTDGNLCTGVLYESGIPTFITVPCPRQSSPPATSAAPLSNAPASNSAVVPANPPASSQPGLSTPAATLTAGPSQPPPTASSPAGGASATPPSSNPTTQAGAGGPGNNGHPQNTAPAGQPQSPVQSSRPVDPKPANPSPAATQAPNQASSGAGDSPSASAPAASPLTTLTVAAGTAVSNPNGVPANSGNGQSPSPTSQAGGSVFGVDEGQDPSSGNNIPPGTPVIPISDCPAVVQCPACPASPAKPPSGSCPCPGRGYSCSECLNGWFCPPEETPMLPAPCGMGWPCYHCKGGWYCAPDSNNMAPAAANDPPVVVIKTVTAFVAPQPTGIGNGGTGDGGNTNGSGNSGNGNGGNGSNGGNGNGNSNGAPGNDDPGAGNGGSPAASTPCTTASNGQYTGPPGNGAGSAPNSIPDNSGSGNGNGNGNSNSSGNGSGNGDAGNGNPGNPASTPCTTTGGQPTDPSGSDGGSGDGSGNSGPANIPEPPAASPAPPPSNPNPPASPNQPPSPVSPAPNGNPPAGYGSYPANPANGNSNNGPGNGSGSGAPSGKGAPSNTGPSIPGPGSNAGAGSGNGSPDNREPKPAPEVTGWEYLGCFKDSAVRTLDGDPSIFFTGSMSNEKCIAHCGSMGFQLAGTEYGKECWCGTAFQLAVRIPEEQCNEVCDGKSTDICGGDWAVTVYSRSGRALSLPSDDDVANGAGGGNGNGNGNGNSGSGTGNNGGAGNPPSAPQNPAPEPPAAPPAVPSASPPQTPGQGQRPPPPAGNPQDSSTPPASPNPAPQPQIDIASLIQSIINALPKAPPDGAYGSSLGARDSGSSDSNGLALPANSAVPDNSAGGTPMMGPGPINPMEGLSHYGDEKKEVPSRNMKRSSIIGRRAAAKFDGIVCVGEDGNDGDCLAKAQV
ncbi:WSC domain-containing protein [Colletotrichum limetticola]|uniref:WSC domain-containing protein n=1 Tax=Colletotrichum limetticola TaxID=1209924 RepID=A0ABQ9QET8_9PEZI|nr:WSC domain-containing protein [Colletotrichum limetticola]